MSAVIWLIADMLSGVGALPRATARYLVIRQGRSVRVMSMATVTIAEVMNSVRCSRVTLSSPRTDIAASSSAPLTAASVASGMSLAGGKFAPSSGPH